MARDHAPTEERCINCAHVFGALDIRGSYGTPDDSVGPFCETCYATIKAHEVAPPLVPVGAAPVEQKEEPYFIEVEKNGCERCGRGKLWAVVCPGGDILGVSFEEEEAATELAEHMNTAYWAGRGIAEPPQ